MKMLEFHVTNEVFELVRKGEKLHEYRNFNNYWKGRLGKIKKPTNAKIVRGYTKDKIPIRIVEISFYKSNKIVNPFYRNFITTSYCFDIEYKLKVK